MNKLPTPTVTFDLYYAPNAPPAVPDVQKAQGFLKAMFEMGMEYTQSSILTYFFDSIMYVQATVDSRDDWTGIPQNYTLYVPDYDGQGYQVIFVEMIRPITGPKYRKIYLQRLAQAGWQQFVRCVLKGFSTLGAFLDSILTGHSTITTEGSTGTTGFIHSLLSGFSTAGSAGSTGPTGGITNTILSGDSYNLTEPGLPPAGGGSPGPGPGGGGGPPGGPGPGGGGSPSPTNGGSGGIGLMVLYGLTRTVISGGSGGGTNSNSTGGMGGIGQVIFSGLSTLNYSMGGGTNTNLSAIINTIISGSAASPPPQSNTNSGTGGIGLIKVSGYSASPPPKSNTNSGLGGIGEIIITGTSYLYEVNTVVVNCCVLPIETTLKITIHQT